MSLFDIMFDLFEKKTEQQYKESVEKGYICPHCNKYLTLVLKKIKEGTSLFCNHCGYRSIWKDGRLQIAHKFNCPYCNERHILIDGYYTCECGNSFRKEAVIGETNKCVILEEDKTVNDILLKCIALLEKIAILSEEGNDGRFNYHKELIISTFELNKEQIAWCQGKKHLKTRETYEIINEIGSYKIKEVENLIESIIKEIKEINANEDEVLNLLCYLILKIGYYNNQYKNFKIIEESIKKSIKVDYENIKKEVFEEIGVSKTDIEEYFKILGLESDANETDIKRAYRKLVQKYHPDKYQIHNLSAEELETINIKFVQIQEAYEIIKEYIINNRC